MARDERTLRRMAWGIALGMTGALFAFAAVFFNMRYAANDDPAIMRILMGYDTGEPATFLLFMHGLLVWPISVLHRIWPLVPWYSCVLLFLLFMSLTIIVKSLMVCFVHCNKSIWFGIILSAAYFIAFGLEHTTYITFTCVAGFLGTAAIAEMFSIDFQHASDREIIIDTAKATLLLSLAYACRLDVLLPLLAYFLLAFLFLVWLHFGFGKKNNRSLRPMIFSLILSITVLGCMAGIRQWELSAFPSQDYLEWQKERNLTMDYYGLEKLPEDLLDQAGWDDATLDMARGWVYLDKDITSDSLRIINEHQKARFLRSTTDRLLIGKNIILLVAQEQPHVFRMINLAFIIGLFTAIGILFVPGKRICFLFTMGCLAGGFSVMLMGLAFMGRVPIRVVLLLVMPAFIMSLMLLAHGLPKMPAFNTILVLLVLTTVAVSAFSASSTLHEMREDKKNPKYTAENCVHLEEYALSHPEHLLITDFSFSEDLRLFPSYTTSTPHNIVLWGGWTLRSAENSEQFRRFGIDAWNFEPEAFLRDDVFFVTSYGPEPSAMLLNWLNAKIGKEISWEVYAQHHDVYLIRFFKV